MHEPYTGGLGSYAVTLIVIMFLQTHPAFAHDGDPNRYGMGGLLMDFFRVYGFLIDYNNVGVCVGRERYIKKEPWMHTRDRGALYCQDPQKESNNVTGSTRQMNAIRYAFNHAFHAL